MTDKTTKNTIVFFDIASSSVIIEQLKQNDCIEHWCNLLVRFEKYLLNDTEYCNFKLYKFLGDGWILIMAHDTDGNSILRLLNAINEKYKDLYLKLIARRLESPPAEYGLTFGMDTGNIIEISLISGTEYVGRPMNIAARLQGAIKDRDKVPTGKLLMSPGSYTSHFIDQKRQPVYKTGLVQRKLRNINNGTEFHCRKVELGNDGVDFTIYKSKPEVSRIKVRRVPTRPVNG